MNIDTSNSKMGGECTVFVGNLPWTVTTEELSTFMSQAGKVISAEVQRHDASGRSKGWGLVTFETTEIALHAVDCIDSQEFNQRKIHVRFDRSPLDLLKGYVVFLGNLPWTFEDTNISEMFKPFNPCDCHVMRNMAGRSRGFALIKFKDGHDAVEAIRCINGTEVEGRVLECRMNRENVSRSFTASERNSVIVRKLSQEFGEDELRAHFEPFGQIISVKIQHNPEGESKGKGSIEFSKRNEALRACSLNRTVWNDMHIENVCKIPEGLVRHIESSNYVYCYQNFNHDHENTFDNNLEH
eukprot:gene11570-24196_t